MSTVCLTPGRAMVLAADFRALAERCSCRAAELERGGGREALSVLQLTTNFGADLWGLVAMLEELAASDRCDAMVGGTSGIPRALPFDVWMYALEQANPILNEVAERSLAWGDGADEGLKAFCVDLLLARQMIIDAICEIYPGALKLPAFQR